MNALQSLTVLPNGRAVATVRGRAHRFESIEVLASWLHPEPEPDFGVSLIATHRALPAHVVTHFQERALTV